MIACAVPFGFEVPGGHVGWEMMPMPNLFAEPSRPSDIMLLVEIQLQVPTLVVLFTPRST